jgi:MFS family permease
MKNAQSLRAPARGAWRHHRPMLLAAVVDTFGEGVFMPLSFLFFLVTTHLGTAEIGLGITVATVAAFPAGFAVGSVVDRVGARRLVMLNNVLSAVGYVGYLFSHNLATLIVSVLFVAVADKIFGTAWPTYVAESANAEESGSLDRLFAVVSAFRNGSLGAGFLCGCSILAFGLHPATVRAIALVNIASSLTTAVILHGDRHRHRRRAVGADAKRSERSGWRALGADRPYLLLIASQAALSCAWIVPMVALPVYTVTVLHLPAWLPSALLGVNFLLIMVLQTRVTDAVAGRPRTATVGVAALSLIGAFAALALAHETSKAMAYVLTVAGILLFVLGEMLWGPTSNALAASAAPPEYRGRYMAAFQLTFSVQSMLGPALVGTLIAAHSSWLWLILASIVASGGIGFGFAKRLLPDAANQPGAAVELV